MDVEDINWDFIEYMKTGRGLFAKSRSLRSFLKPILNLQGEERILDVGCGIGTVTKLIRPLLGDHGEIIGIDTNPALIDYGNRHWARYPNTRLEIGDATQIAYPDAAFDIVISMGLFEFISALNQDRVLSEMARVLNPAGILVVIQIDTVHYLTVPADESFTTFYADILEGMRLMGVDLQLTGFKASCQQRNWVFEEFTLNIEYRTQITEKFVEIFEENRASYYKDQIYLNQLCEFNFQFLRQVGWTKQRIWDYLDRQYSLENQIAFFRAHLGEEIYQKTPILVFRVHL